MINNCGFGINQNLLLMTRAMDPAPFMTDAPHHWWQWRGWQWSWMFSLSVILICDLCVSFCLILLIAATLARMNVKIFYFTFISLFWPKRNNDIWKHISFTAMQFLIIAMQLCFRLFTHILDNVTMRYDLQNLALSSRIACKQLQLSCIMSIYVLLLCKLLCEVSNCCIFPCAQAAKDGILHFTRVPCGWSLKNSLQREITICRRAFRPSSIIWFSVDY